MIELTFENGQKRHVVRGGRKDMNVECVLPDVFHMNNNYVQKVIELHLF